MAAQGFFEAVNSVNQKLKPPSMFLVIILNDDYTEMGFVVNVLQTVFDKGHEEAAALMLEVHEKGAGIAGRYVYDIAVTKQAQAMRMAEREGYPLRLSVEEELE
jgi:ATP-dependent Clp protease adaptor protein ClpS